MSSTLTEKAVVGRRVEYTYHRSLHDDRADLSAPGIITGTETAVNGVLLVRVRLDGKRSSLTLPAEHDGLRYLDEVVPVPELPMGRFLPVADDMNGIWAKDGVLFATLGEDGEDLVVLTGDEEVARKTILAYAQETGLDLEPGDLSFLEERWAVFTWEPEEFKYPWTLSFASEGDDMAVRIHYLPA